MTQEQLRMQMLAGIITESQYKAKLNENEDEAPLVITVKVTEEGKTKMRLYTGPSSIKMTGGNNSDYYYIGNTKAELGKETNIYFARYRDDIKEIQTMYLALIPGNSKFNELVNSEYLNSNQIKNLPSDIRKVPDGYFKFENGFEKGMKDHRGDFEIISVK
jgi:hypothetical protein